jgi:hypothetical protein
MSAGPLPRSARVDVHDLGSAAAALAAVLVEGEATDSHRPESDMLAQAVPCCVEVADLLAAVAGSLETLALSMFMNHRESPSQPVIEQLMGDGAADLHAMPSLLRRVRLVIAPTLADPRRLAAEDDPDP